MQFFTTICALSAVVVASEQANKVEKRQAVPSIPLSVELVLFTALPSSLLALAETNQQAVATAVASEFAAGTIPSWFASLPTNVQTYLVPSSVLAQVTAAPSNLTSAAGPVATGHNHTSSAISSAGTALGGILAGNGTVVGSNGTSIVNGTLISNSTVIATQASNGSFVTASGNYSRSSTRTGVMVSTSSMAMTTAGALGSATSAAVSATSSAAGGSGAGGLEVPTGLLGVGLAALVGLVGVFAL